MGIPRPEDNPDIIRKEFARSDCRAQRRFIALCDVLGFTRLVEQSHLSSLAEKYDAMLREAKASCIMVKTYPSRTPSIPKRYRAGSAVFSDSILLWTDSARDDRKGDAHKSDSFFAYVAGVFAIALKMRFPLRIGIAYGQCVINPAAGLFLGRPIIDAYRTQQAQDWVGVACHPSCFDSPEGGDLCPTLKDGWQPGPLVEYDIPIKSEFEADMNLTHSIDWPFWGSSEWGGLVSLEELLRRKTREYQETPFGSRWESALRYLEFRLSKWKSIDLTFGTRSDYEDTPPSHRADTEGD